MKAEHSRVLQDCANGALSSALTFPEIVGRLADMGVERYHADYTRNEITYYLTTGDSEVIATPHDDDPIAMEFFQAGVAAAVGESQRGEHTYVDFVRKTRAAGCVGYFVQITGRRVLYFGRQGETHVEWFPNPPSP